MYQRALAESLLILMHVKGPLIIEVDSECATTASLIAQMLLLDVNLDHIIINRMS